MTRTPSPQLVEEFTRSLLSLGLTDSAQASVREVGAYAAARAVDVAALVGTPEFDEGARAAADAVGLYAGLAAVAQADAADLRARAFLIDAIRLTASALG